MAKLVRQPPGSTLCGQACVAILAGVSLKRAVAAIGHRKGTSSMMLKRALTAFGWQMAKRSPRLPPGRNWRGLAGTQNGKDSGSGHWVVFDRGDILDPAEPARIPLDVYLKGMAVAGEHFTSIYRVTRG